MDWGVRGLEVYYRRFAPETVARMEELAAELGLLATGGSDYHGDTMTYAEAQADDLRAARGGRQAAGSARGGWSEVAP